MGRRYSTNGTIAAVASTTKTMLDLIAATTTRARIYDFSVGTTGAPADNVMTYTVQKFTASGTFTAATMTLNDAGDPAALLTSGSNNSTEPTYTANAVLWILGINQRASYRWVAAPLGEFIVPATANNGIGFGVLSPAYTGVAGATLSEEE
jgi:hypothetical protein